MLQALQDVLTEMLVKTSVKVSGKTSGKILALIRENALITIPELALLIGVTERSSCKLKTVCHVSGQPTAAIGQ